MYLHDLARVTGGRNFEANSSSNLDKAFSSIAEELRQQYSIGYYPDKEGQAGQRESRPTERQWRRAGCPLPYFADSRTIAG